MALRGVLALALLASVAAPIPVCAEDTVVSARALLAAWHEDPARIDQARALLEIAAAGDARPDALVELARAWFLTGEFRAGVHVERATAYEHGSAAARRAIARAPGNDRARFLLAINCGRLAEIKGPMRALTLVSTVREESESVLRLNPTNADGLILAASLAAEMPGFLGGDRARAETLFKRALELDPHQTGGRMELARLYIATRRYGDARRELQRVMDEPAPTDLPRWTVSEVPRARALLGELADQGRFADAPTQSP
jgi:tetratricopeptide (TPR) repeat protein